MKQLATPIPPPRGLIFHGLSWDVVAVVFLIGLGVLHIPAYLLSPLPWEDPRSFRKPILFGISTGLTLGSLLLLIHDLRPNRWDRILRGLLCHTLVIEVLLITVQAWRRVPSHFNRTTITDTWIEYAMLICILTAVVLIAGLTGRSLQGDAFRDASPARVLAQRAGMVFLLLSCVLGIGITILGHYMMLQGGSPERFGPRGVLKFPHGAVLHAIQTLVGWAWLCDSIGSPRGRWSVGWLALAHLLFVTYAIRQTWLGESRWETDAFGWGLLGCTVASAFVAILGAIGARK